MLFALLSFAPIVFLRLSDEFVRLLRVDEIDLDPAFVCLWRVRRV